LASSSKLRGTSHSTPKKPDDYTKNVDAVNKEVDRSKYQQTNANEDSGVDTQSQQDKNTVDSLKTDTQVDQEDANQGAQEITNVLGSSNNSLMQNQDQNQTQNQGNDEGWRELNKNGQSEHHNSYTQFGSINKVKSKANQEIKDSEKGIKQSNEKTQKEFDNVKQRDQNNKSHQQKEQQKATGRLEVANQNLVDHLDTPKTQTSLDNSKDIIALAKSTTTLTPAKSTTILTPDKPTTTPTLAESTTTPTPNKSTTTPTPFTTYSLLSRSSIKVLTTLPLVII
jgi:hypothetical protein